MIALLPALLALITPAVAESEAQPSVIEVGPGVYAPIFPASELDRAVEVGRFRLDRRQVTEREFVQFVREHPTWRRDQVSPLFADARYLSHWAEPDTLGDDLRGDEPVTRVSWFAARAYCEAQGGRLPTEAEWELAAAASATKPDATGDPEHAREILDWYSRPARGPLRAAGAGPANYWGAHDLHGLVWEWVEDFNASLVSLDPRDEGGADNNLFCGAGASSAAEKGDYAAFMRIAFRSSLKANFTGGSLGFRCAYDIPSDASELEKP